MPIWTSTLADFRDRVAAAEPMPAAVSVSAVTASLGLSLLIKVLQIVARRKSFAGDPKRLAEIVEGARGESANLAACADQDTGGNELPLRAARSAIAGLDLCFEAAPMVTGAIAADLDAATMLLAAAARAILLCVRSNGGSDEECLRLENRLVEYKTF
jgi:formiminotetrahydrofolate cyclodeaminase